MFRTISQFLTEIVGSEHPPAQFDDNDYRLAAAALLVHVVTTDNKFDDAEREKLRQVLAYRFDLGLDQAEQLIEAAINADREAVDLYQFTSVINRALDEEGRKRLVEMMFEVAYADGALSEFEDNVVWRAAELLHVTSRDRVTLRGRIRGQRADKEN